MLTHVYDKVTETMFFITVIQLIEESIDEDGTNLYNMDLVSCDGEMTIYNVPATITMEDGTVTGYAIADISNVITDLTDVGKTTYNYHSKKNTQLYDCKCDDGVLINYPEINTEPHTTVSIYQGSKEPTTKEATTIAELIEILEEIQDYTEVAISGAFCKAIKRSKYHG